MIVGRVAWAVSGDVTIQETPGADLEVGDLLVWDDKTRRLIMQAVSAEHGTLMDRRARDMAVGMNNRGERAATAFYENDFPDFMAIHARPLVSVGGDGKPYIPKYIPPAFGEVRRATAADLGFLPGPGPGRLYLGDVRSGSRTIRGAGLYVDAATVFSHHVLVPATTGRGKSNLVKCILHGLLDAGEVGMLVLDAHGEYAAGLASHGKAGRRLAVYGGRAPGSRPLRISARDVTPHHFKGVMELTEAQERMMWDLWAGHRREWIPRLFGVVPDDIPEQQRITRTVLRQKLNGALALNGGRTFTMEDDAGHVMNDIVERVSRGHVVILDVSGLGSSAETMVGCMAASRIMYGYRTASDRGELDAKRPAAVVLEEAPRMLAGGLGDGNPFAVIAREGRKFKVGLCAVTQLSSVIPREIMANMNTKIILGNEMRAEREALVDSAAQDLSGDRHVISSLNVGEGIISSVFVPFAVPIRIPNFADLAKPRRPVKVV